MQVGTVALERIASRGWQGTSSRVLGEWLLRAGSGFTGRANSVLPLGSPGCSFDEALLVIEEFYRQHQLKTLFQVPHTPETVDVDGALADRGWTLFNASGVLTSGLDSAIRACPPVPGLPPAEFANRPSPRWLAGYVYRGTPLPDSAVAVLENAADVVFCSVNDADEQAGVVRGVVTDGWLGVTALTVDRTRRRAGVGRHLMGEVLRWAAAQGARNAYLQVADENVAALGFYDRIGFARHHGYHYRRAP